ncbi:5'-nucleotidase C-terminal domain-containing protein [Streptococcus hillyeri]|uniref:LPXTG cell wall anchor domain-containing protein n=1 Tax=Streptococcus hillyeri TaxID=2282420 RepID=A0A3L9DPP6_9STRE|nr:bifunctional metallophosphatase/5'-nucleotidase [Streptococcus hillyeri]RLY01609.1 LPXTG cell wall anchor domain-containing protein [Streptococcus hillyeri]
MAKKKRIILKSSILAVVAGLSVAASQTTFADDVAVQIMGVNDFHGALDATGTARLEGETVRNAGTAAQLDAYMDDSQAEFEAEATNVDAKESIRVQAGDMVGASPSNSGLLQDEPTVKVFNEMDFDYGTLGNHEFDEGLEEYNRIMTGTAPKKGQFNEIVDNYTREASKQEIVIANVVDKATGEIPFNWKPYAIKEIPVNDKVAQIGFIGVVTTEIPNLVLKKNYEQYTFINEAEAIAKYSRELNEKGVHAIVVLAHVPSTSKDGIAEGDSAAMMAKVNELYPENSVDIIFAGHNHVYTNGTVAGKTLIVQSTSQGKAYSDVRAVYDTDIADFKAVPTAKIIAVAPDKKEPSAKIKAIVDEANEIVKKVTEQKIGTAAEATDISREVNDFKESPVGNLVTTAQLAIARKSGHAVDFAMTNNGGIRADLKVQPDGTVTWGAAQAVQPFGNILQVVEMTGEQIYAALNQQYDEDEKYFLQMSGLKYIYTKADDTTPGQTYKVAKAFKDDGTEIDRAATYKVLINDFLYGGGDGFSVFKGTPLVGAIDPDTEVFVKYLSDLEKAGQKIQAGIKDTKVFVENYVEAPKTENKPEDGAQTPDKQPEVKPETGNQTPEQQPEVKPLADNKTSVVKSENKTVAEQAKVTETKALPKTGDDSLHTLLFSMSGLAAFSLAGYLKRKEERD